MMNSLPDDAFVELDAPQNVRAYKKAIESQGHRVSIHEGDNTLTAWLKKEKPDLCFNTCEGFFGESREAQIPALLEMLGIPYTGPTPLAAAVTQDKPMTKIILEYYGILTPKFQVFESHEQSLDKSLHFPLFVKPAHEGTGMGIKNDSIIRNKTQLRNKVRKIIKLYKQPALVEEYIVGRDITCGIIGNSSDVHFPPISEIDYSGYRKSLAPIYGVLQKIKYGDEYRYKCPAPLSESMAKKVRDITHQVFAVTGCRDFGRVDFRLTKENKLYVFEINALPGIALNSDLLLAVQAEGWTHRDLVVAIFNAGMKRYGYK